MLTPIKFTTYEDLDASLEILARNNQEALKNEKQRATKDNNSVPTPKLISMKFLNYEDLEAQLESMSSINDENIPLASPNPSVPDISLRNVTHKKSPLCMEDQPGSIEIIKKSGVPENIEAEEIQTKLEENGDGTKKNEDLINSDISSTPPLNNFSVETNVQPLFVLDDEIEGSENSQTKKTANLVPSSKVDDDPKSRSYREESTRKKHSRPHREPSQEAGEDREGRHKADDDGSGRKKHSRSHRESSQGTFDEKDCRNRSDHRDYADNRERRHRSKSHHTELADGKGKHRSRYNRESHKNTRDSNEALQDVDGKKLPSDKKLVVSPMTSNGMLNDTRSSPASIPRRNKDGNKQNFRNISELSESEASGKRKTVVTQKSASSEHRRRERRRRSTERIPSSSRAQRYGENSSSSSKSATASAGSTPNASRKNTENQPQISSTNSTSGSKSIPGSSTKKVSGNLKTNPTNPTNSSNSVQAPKKANQRAASVIQLDSEIISQFEYTPETLSEKIPILFNQKLIFLYILDTFIAIALCLSLIILNVIVMQPNITFLDRSVIVEIFIILECGEYVHYYLVVMILIRIEESTGMYDSIFFNR